MKREMNKRYKSILIFTLLLLIFLAYQATKMLAANLNFYQAFQLEKNWQENKSLTSSVQFEQALSSIKQSNLSHTNNPHYLITQGLIYEWGGISEVFDNKKQRELLLQAKQYYLTAVKLRPTWPITWATLAILKWRLKEVDQEMINFLKQADKYGRHTPEVNLAWLDVGLYLYKSKSVYSSQIINGLRVHTELMIKAPLNRAIVVNNLRRHNAIGLVCRWLINYNFDTSWYQEKVCEIKT